jgi:hypothetical protein
VISRQSPSEIIWEAEENFTAVYMQHETAAVAAESKADTHRWEQCRLVYEAVESGRHSRRSFAKVVGKSEPTIRYHYTAW